MKKRNGGALSREEIYSTVHGFVRGEIPDYQMAALLMAIYFRGMEPREVSDLTMAMVDSGERVDLSSVPGVKVDKHSTGGVGDKTTLVLAPLVAAAGIPVAKMSGRGLGHTGGTLDKLESIPGFRVGLSPQEFLDNVRRIGLAVVGQTGRLVPADGKLYALRDVTATVDSLPLIASSIMSKKIAGGAQAIVLDVKTGSGAFMKSFADSLSLAQVMVSIGERVGRGTRAVISDMDQPLGRAVGNALEVKEAIATLTGEGPADLTELCLTLGSQMVSLAGLAADPNQARSQLEELLATGKAFQKLEEMVTAQGGQPQALRNLSLLPAAKRTKPFQAARGGYVQSLDALMVGRAAMALGAGRATKESPIDLAVGVILEKKVGEAIEKGDVLAQVHYNSEAQVEEAFTLLTEAFRIGAERPPARPLIQAIVTAEGVEKLGVG
ncbi:MAG: pyrimidine-nucleoside phosphorylase [Firmicutes bacterium]|nr:pyrimidine-nucleoside phosphorylase [Bacillota bacterium]